MSLNLHVPSSSNANCLSTNIAEQRTANSHNSSSSLSRSSRSRKRDIRKALSHVLLLLRDSKCNLLSIGRGNESTLLLRRSQSRLDVSESNSVGTHAELWTPLFRNGLGQTHDTGFGEGVVGLSCVAVKTGGGRNVDDVAGFTILYAEVWCSCTDELEGSGVVQCEDGVPLLIGDLVDHAVPCESGVVDDDMDLAAAELSGLLYEGVDVVVVEDVACD